MPRWAALFGVLAVGIPLLSACGGGPGKPGNAAVAHLGTSTTTKAPGSQSDTTQPGGTSGAGLGAGPGPGAVSGSGVAMADPGASQSQALAFAHCMQTHGVPNFPEPNAQGVFSGIDPNEPGYAAARSECSHLLPNGGQPTAAQRAQAAAQALKFSHCMRAHGIADFPDPQVLNGGAQIRISLQGGKGSDLNPQNPQFQAASKACQGFTPFKGAAKIAATGGPK
jgi:hypothetical protein